MKNLRIFPVFIVFMLLLVSCGSPQIQPDLSSETLSEVPATTAALPTKTIETIPVWLTVPVTDARTGRSFTINDLKGKVIIVEGMATWCPSCWAQGREFKKYLALSDKNSDLVIISLTLDLKEDSQALNEYAKIDNFEWLFVTSSLPMYHDLGNRYGALYLDPTLGPLLIVDRKGDITHSVSGIKKAEEIKSIVDPLLAAR
jgi:cytochrome oxidase Cu insertion factor (SCO1/SenC/PrrC family)